MPNANLQSKGELKEKAQWKKYSAIVSKRKSDIG